MFDFLMRGLVEQMAKVSKGPAGTRLTGHRSLSVAQTEFERMELARSGRLFHGGITAVAGGIGVVSDLPTTTAAAALYNNNPAGSGKCLVLDAAGFYTASGTPAAGATLLGAVTSQAVADAQRPTAHSSNWSVGCARGGADNSNALWKSSLTIPAGAFWFALGSSFQLAAANLGQGAPLFDVKGALVAPPGYAICFAILTGAGTSPAYGLSARFSVLELDIDN